MNQNHEIMEARDNKLFTVLIIYDISSTKRRNKMVAFLEQYAVRVQESAFEGALTERQYEALSACAPKIIDETTDSLRIYITSDTKSARMWGIGAVVRENVIIL